MCLAYEDAPTTFSEFLCAFGDIPLHSRLSFPATEPPDPRRVSEGFQKGFLKGSLRVFEGF